MEIPEPAWDRVVEDLGPRLYRYFCASFSPATASDAVQETLIRLVQKFRDGEFQSEKGSLASYAFGIAHWIRMEFLKRTPLPLLEDESTFNQVPAESSTENFRRLQHLRWAISRLGPTEQEIILLSIDAEMDLSQISDTLKLPLGTVKSHIHRAKENLRQIMEVQNDRH